MAAPVSVALVLPNTADLFSNSLIWHDSSQSKHRLRRWPAAAGSGDRRSDQSPFYTIEQPLWQGNKGPTCKQLCWTYDGKLVRVA